MKINSLHSRTLQVRAIRNGLGSHQVLKGLSLMTNSNHNFVDPALIGYHPDVQAKERAASFGTPIHDIPSQFRQGWAESKGIIMAFPATVEWAKKVNEYRKAEVDRYLNADGGFTIGYKDDGEAIEMKYAKLGVHCQNRWFPDGKPIFKKGDPIVNVCQRRSSVLMASELAFLDANPEGVFKVPVIVHNYTNDRDMLMERLRENNDAGRSGYAETDQLHITTMLLKDEGIKEHELQRVLNVKRGTAQKLHAWGNTCNSHPKLNLTERAALPHPVDAEGKRVKKPDYENGGWYPLSAVRSTAARTLNGGASEAKKMDDLVVTECYGGKRDHKHSATNAEVEAYIEAVMVGIKNDRKMMSKNEIDNAKQGCPSRLVKDVLQAVLDNSPMNLNKAAAKVAELEDQDSEG